MPIHSHSSFESHSYVCYFPLHLHAVHVNAHLDSAASFVSINPLTFAAKSLCIRFSITSSVSAMCEIGTHLSVGQGRLVCQMMPSHLLLKGSLSRSVLLSYVAATCEQRHTRRPWPSSSRFLTSTARCVIVSVQQGATL